MGKIAFVFPGQGAQAVGMARDIYAQSEAARAIIEQADEVLGFKLSRCMFEGPEAELKQTVNTQPALLTASVAMLAALEPGGMRADYVAGHSLGEYSALVAAGVLEFADALRTVRKRGELMEQAVPGGKGAMAAVLGAEREALAELCKAISAEVGVVELANVNCPGQIVISGTSEGVTAACERVKEAGAKRAIALDVSGPFHSSLMAPAAEGLRAVLEPLTLHEARLPVVANVTAAAVTDGATIRELLVQQVVAPVLWEDSVRYMCAQGVDTFVEIGSGSVLSGLIKKTDKTAAVHTVNSVEALQQLNLVRG